MEERREQDILNSECIQLLKGWAALVGDVFLAHQAVDHFLFLIYERGFLREIEIWTRKSLEVLFQPSFSDSKLIVV